MTTLAYILEKREKEAASKEKDQQKGKDNKNKNKVGPKSKTTIKEKAALEGGLKASSNVKTYDSNEEKQVSGSHSKTSRDRDTERVKFAEDDDPFSSRLSQEEPTDIKKHQKNVPFKEDAFQKINKETQNRQKTFQRSLFKAKEIKKGSEVDNPENLENLEGSLKPIIPGAPREATLAKPENLSQNILSKSKQNKQIKQNRQKLGRVFDSHSSSRVLVKHSVKSPTPEIELPDPLPVSNVPKKKKRSGYFPEEPQI